MKTKEEILQLVNTFWSKYRYDNGYKLTGSLTYMGEKDMLVKLYTQCQEDMQYNSIKFAEWLSDSGWIRRPFEEKSGIYLYDDHSEECLNDLYVNPKTINELYDIFNSQQTRLI